MKRSALLILPLVCAPLATLWALPEPEAPANWTNLQDEVTPLQEAMGALKGGQRGLKKLIGDPVANRAQLIELLASMESACIQALGAELPLPDGATAERAELFKVGYKRRMTDTLQQVLTMHEATLKQDKAALEAAYEELGQLKKSGHKEFRDF